MTEKKFLVVMGAGGLAHSPFRHGSEDAAFREAERLSRIHGGIYVVLEAKGKASRVDVMVEKFGEEIPF